MGLDDSEPQDPLASEKVPSPYTPQPWVYVFPFGDLRWVVGVWGRVWGSGLPVRSF